MVSDDGPLTPFAEGVWIDIAPVRPPTPGCQPRVAETTDHVMASGSSVAQAEPRG
jgi:hypothetical protein